MEPLNSNAWAISVVQQLRPYIKSYTFHSPIHAAILELVASVVDEGLVERARTVVPVSSLRARLECPHIYNDIASWDRHRRGRSDSAERNWCTSQFFLPDTQRRIDRI